MRSMSFYDKLSDLNDNLYKGVKKVGYEIIDSYTDTNGTYIGVFNFENELIVAIKGTDIISPIDYRNDIAMCRKHIPSQYYSVEKFLKDKNYKNPIITGYSLGGSIAQIVGSMYGYETITFEAYGTGDLKDGGHTLNILNFGHVYDPVFMANFENHIGEIYIISLKKYFNALNIFLHFPFNHGYPSNSEKFNGDINSYYKTDSIKTDVKTLIKPYSDKARELTSKTLKKYGIIKNTEAKKSD